jgi:hypothetical protein
MIILDFAQFMPSRVGPVKLVGSSRSGNQHLMTEHSGIAKA